MRTSRYGRMITRACFGSCSRNRDPGRGLIRKPGSHEPGGEEYSAGTATGGIWRIEQEARKPAEMQGEEFGNQKARNLTWRLRRPNRPWSWLPGFLFNMFAKLGQSSVGERHVSLDNAPGITIPWDRGRPARLIQCAYTYGNRHQAETSA